MGALLDLTGFASVQRVATFSWGRTEKWADLVPIFVIVIPVFSGTPVDGDSGELSFTVSCSLAMRSDLVGSCINLASRFKHRLVEGHESVLDAISKGCRLLAPYVSDPIGLRLALVD